VRAQRAVGVAAAALLLAAAAPPDDPLVDQQWHLPHIGAFAAWDAGRGEGITVAVVDTGVDADHPDLLDRVVRGIDLVDRGTQPHDENGHGTIVAGIVAAVAGNGAGGAGVAPEARIMPVRVLGPDGEGSSRTVAEGIRWAADRGADIINLSLADAPGQTQGMTNLITTDVELAIREASLRGALVVVAAGNEGRTTTPYRRNLPALVIGASDRDDEAWRHSNRDDRTLFAPGVQIVSTYPEGGYVKADGTSFAAPVVSAAAAILMEQGMTPGRVRDRLVDTAVDIGVGAGRLDLAAAAGREAEPRPPTPTATAPPGPEPAGTPTEPLIEPIEDPSTEPAEDPSPEPVEELEPEPVEDGPGVVIGDGPDEPAAGSWVEPDPVPVPLPTWPVGLAATLLAINLVGLVSWAAYARGRPAARGSGR
jgi:thermitase